MRADQIPRQLGEVQAFPAGLADDLPKAPWTVAHVKPRQEKLLAHNLRHLGVPHLLFLEHRIRTYARQGIQHSLVPLLPGYLFLIADESAYDPVYRTERLVRLITVREHVDLRSDLRDLVALVLKTDAPMLVRPELVPGRPVVLKTGSLAGLRGVIARRKGRKELVVNIHLLGHSVAVAIAAADADPDGEAAPTA